MSPVVLAWLLGLGTGLGLIVAIGAQNAFVLRTGIAAPTRIVAVVVVLCTASDIALIAVGVLGMRALATAAPAALIVMRILGAGFLIVYGLLAARRAVRPGALRVDAASAPGGAHALRTAVVTALAFTWLNPHVYLDTVVFVGSIANQQGPGLRWWWAVGAMTASVVWFAALGFGARMLRPVFARPSAWRVLDVAIAVVMIGLGLKLAILG